MKTATGTRPTEPWLERAVREQQAPTPADPRRLGAWRPLPKLKRKPQPGVVDA